MKVLDLVIGLRVKEEDEVAGLDLSQHAETAYETASFNDGSRFSNSISGN